MNPSTTPKKTDEKKKKPANEKHYVTNKALLEELYIWRDSAEEPADRIISENLGKMLYMIGRKLTNHFRFRGYSHEMKQDMISLGCYKAITGLKNYNFEYTNPFAYITQIFWNANVATCVKYYKHKNGMKQCTIDAISELETSGIGPGQSVYLRQIQKNLQDFLEELETADEVHAKNPDEEPLI